MNVTVIIPGRFSGRVNSSISRNIWLIRVEAAHKIYISMKIIVNTVAS